jgi:hypothetical protein
MWHPFMVAFIAITGVRGGCVIGLGKLPPKSRQEFRWDFGSASSGTIVLKNEQAKR